MKRGSGKKSHLKAKKRNQNTKPKQSHSHAHVHERKHSSEKQRLNYVTENPESQDQHLHQRESQNAAQKNSGYVQTGISGMDKLFEHGMPKGVSVLIAGGAGSGKTILGLQILANACKRGEKCLYMSFEESEEHLRQHMEDFGWDAKEFEKKKLLVIKRFSIFDVARSIDAMLEKAKGELLIDVKPVILPNDFKPDWVVVDSLTAISSAFTKKGDSYRSYIEQLFRHFEKLKINSFCISETKEIPTIFSTTGVEEFLADGVIVLYNIRKGNVRESAIEVLKMRGAKHTKKIVAMQIQEGVGIEIYPEQEIFSNL